jgi:hypothetical protein
LGQEPKRSSEIAKSKQAAARPIYLLRLRPEKGIEPITALRGGLKLIVAQVWPALRLGGSGRRWAMNARLRLPNRRASLTFTFECNGLRYLGTISRFSDGRLAEIFISNAKTGSHSDSAAKDSAVVCSIALQHGVPIDVIRHALLRDSHGRPSSPLGAALDVVVEREP